MAWNNLRAGDLKTAMDYMIREGIKPSSWKLTDKSLVWYDGSARHIVPIAEMRA